jgi:hypothetical protein
MNWPKRKLFSVGAVLIWIAGCGVKGDPLPPEKPVELGRGRPTYKRATEGIRIEKKKTVRAKDKDDKDEDEDGEE